MTETTEKQEKEKEKDANLEEAKEHFHAARSAMRNSIKALIPAGHLENRRAARKEFLLGLRKLLDVAIDHTEKK
jgi:hypothetical protein